ncbi:MAG TPA: hypothetical protein VFS36_09950 [Chitinophagaceae bacterium]|nr:hypothetical protein [Chitinophagaceae bacterium]
MDEPFCLQGIALQETETNTLYEVNIPGWLYFGVSSTVWINQRTPTYLACRSSKKTVSGADDIQLIANNDQFIQLRWKYKNDYWKEWLPIKKISISREGRFWYKKFRIAGMI